MGLPDGRQRTIVSSSYVAGGMPFAFTQDFLVIIVTTRVRSTMGGYIFTCVCPITGGGVTPARSQLQAGGVPPSFVMGSPFLPAGGTPILPNRWGTISFLTGGYPILPEGGITSKIGWGGGHYAPISTGWGTSSLAQEWMALERIMPWASYSFL